jgi:hypothetical protein
LNCATIFGDQWSEKVQSFSARLIAVGITVLLCMRPSDRTMISRPRRFVHGAEIECGWALSARHTL